MTLALAFVCLITERRESLGTPNGCTRHRWTVNYRNRLGRLKSVVVMQLALNTVQSSWQRLLAVLSMSRRPYRGKVERRGLKVVLRPRRVLNLGNDIPLAVNAPILNWQRQASQHPVNRVPNIVVNRDIVAFAASQQRHRMWECACAPTQSSECAFVSPRYRPESRCACRRRGLTALDSI